MSEVEEGASVLGDDWSMEYALTNQREKTRRRFILVSFADFGLVLLVWVLNTVSHGADWVTDFKHEFNVTNPKFFSESLLDVALLSGVRLSWLMCWYAVLHCTFWLPVALSTSTTSVFLIAKVLYFFRGKSGTAPEYILIVGSFVVAWFELWLSPVEPPKIMNRRSRSSARQSESDTAVLVRGSSAAAQGYRTDDGFGTAQEHASSSDEAGPAGSDRRRKSKLPVYRAYSNQEYIDAAKGAMATARQWYEQTSGWETVKKVPLIKSMHVKEHGKVYYLNFTLKCSASQAFHILHAEAEDSPKWNKTVLECKCIFRIDDSTDLTYCVSAPALSGCIASRDFLDVRYVEHEQGDAKRHWLCNVSVFSTILPPGARRKIIRGVNGPSLWVLTPISGDQECTLEWIMNTNLKGDLPTRLVNRSMTTFLVQFSEALKSHVQKKGQVVAVTSSSTATTTTHG